MSRRPFTPKVVTANALLEGDAVWLTEDDRWSTHMADAELIADEAVAQDRLLHAMSRGAEVVGSDVQHLVGVEVSHRRRREVLQPVAVQLKPLEGRQAVKRPRRHRGQLVVGEV